MQVAARQDFKSNVASVDESREPGRQQSKGMSSALLTRSGQ
jgi:hypothetical protein